MNYKPFSYQKKRHLFGQIMAYRKAHGLGCFNSFGISNSDLLRRIMCGERVTDKEWRIAYKLFNPDSDHGRIPLPDDFYAEAIPAILAGKATQADVARRYNISPKTVRERIKEYKSKMEVISNVQH